MPRRKGEVTHTISFDEVVAMVGCPYCHVSKGDNCRQRKVKILDYPHKSRAGAALRILRQQETSNEGES